MDVIEAIYNRRSVREYTDRQVDRATVLELIQAAIQAPSAVNQQPWVFAVIQDRSLLKRYSDLAKRLFAQSRELESMAAELRAMVSDPTFNIFYNAGTLIVICAKRLGQHPDWDCCLAAQNLMLAAHARGLASCPIGFAWPLFEQLDIRAELNIPLDAVVVLPIIVGYPARPGPPVSRNEPEITFWK